jgi:uncharacterized protein YndB with AHSA1/START domain
MAAESSPAKTLVVTLPSDTEIVLTRVFDAPRALVFEAHTKPEHVARWFGLRGSTLPVCEIDLRVGGAYRFVLREPSGSDMPIKGVYREIVPPERLVYTEIFEQFEEQGGEALVTMTLEERNGKTTLTSRSVYRSKEVRDAVVQSGMEEGAAETYDRLAEHLATMARS